MPNNTEKLSCEACRVILPSYKKYLVYALTGMIVTFFAGFYVGHTAQKEDGQITPKVTPQSGSYDEGYQAGLEFARNQLEDEEFRLTEPDYNIEEVIQSIRENEIVLQDNRVIYVDNNTVIEEYVEKPGEQVEKEDAEYSKLLDEYEARVDQAPGEEPLPLPDAPESYIIRPLTFSDLRVGDIIEVFSDVDIRTLDRIKAVRINLIDHRPKNYEEEEELIEE